MRFFAAALLTCGIVASPVEAADLSFSFATTESDRFDHYYSGIGTITVDETSGIGGRYRVLDVNASGIFGVFGEGRNLLGRHTGPIDGVDSRRSFITFDESGAATDFDIRFSSSDRVFSVSLSFNSGSPQIYSNDNVRFTSAVVAIGNFVPPVIQPPVAPAVPEPATWAMMIGGFGLVGGAMRRGQKVAVIFA